METTHVPSTYLAEILHLLQALSEVEERLNSPILQAKDCEDLIKQEECLKVRHKAFLTVIGFHYFVYCQSALTLRVICFVSVQPLSVMYAYMHVYLWRQIGTKYKNIEELIYFYLFHLHLAGKNIRISGKYVPEWERKDGERQLHI